MGFWDSVQWGVRLFSMRTWAVAHLGLCLFKELDSSLFRRDPAVILFTHALLMLCELACLMWKPTSLVSKNKIQSGTEKMVAFGIK